MIKLKKIVRLIVFAALAIALIFRSRIAAYCVVCGWKGWEIDGHLYDDHDKRVAELMYLGQSSVPALKWCIDSHEFGKFSQNIKLNCLETLTRLHYTDHDYFSRVAKANHYPAVRFRSLLWMARRGDDAAYAEIKNLLMTSSGRNYLNTNSTQRDIYNGFVLLVEGKDKAEVSRILDSGLKEGDRVIAWFSEVILANYALYAEPRISDGIHEKIRQGRVASNEELLSLLELCMEPALMNTKFQNDDFFCGSCRDSLFWKLMA